ncbi:MAG: hypothetical protein KatS3mg094_054 [Candidatus Parcubacteria bacterium]|nr:MAG: hypothetical protein KatS3mg094_054 [Candidatus Parcubacteria bacterium]
MKNYLVIKRKVKYLRLEIREFNLRVIVPEGFSGDVEKVIERHKRWLEKKFALLNEIKSLSEGLEIYNHENLEEIVDGYIDEISQILKVRPKEVSFRNMKVRWGSCTSDGRLIFNKKLKFLPKELIRYVAIHEMCHLLVRNHKKEFWQLVEKLCPEFKNYQKLLVGYKMRLENNFKLSY